MLQSSIAIFMEHKHTFQNLIRKLEEFWANKGCIIVQPYDMEVGAGTFHPTTFLRAIGPEPWNCAHVQASRRPADGRYGEHPNRGQHFYQFQVVLKPSPAKIQDWYLESLAYIGINPVEHDLRFVEDNWEGPTLGAWGFGWEVWLNGMEITQFTYFQQVGGLECNPVMGEIAYGIERISLYLQQKSATKDLVWCFDKNNNPITYGQIFGSNEREMSIYNFEKADTQMLLQQFDAWENECVKMLALQLPVPAYDMVLKTSHIFNVLHARKVLSATLRQTYILRIRNLAKQVATEYYNVRQELGFPLLNQEKNPN